MLKKINAKHYTGILLILCILLNANTIRNEYALDDSVAITENLNVQAGFAGITAILTTDAFQGYLDKMGAESPVTGGRFRPLSIVSFAVEQEIFGNTYGADYRLQQQEITRLKNAKASESGIRSAYAKLNGIDANMKQSNLSIAGHRHVIQLLFYMLLLFVMFRFLEKHVYNGNALLAFLTTLLFLVHPVHTEVLANLKSRDEIFSLLFCILSFQYSFEYLKNNSRKNLVLLLVFFILALLSKEYALVLPFIILTGWYCKTNLKPSQLINPASKGLLLTLLVFVFIRFSVFSNAGAQAKITDVLNDPYLYATAGKAFASKVSMLLEYFRVLFFPVNLSSDYSYNHFSYLSFGSLKFLLSFFLYAAMAILFIRLLLRRNELAFPLAVFLGFLMLVNNLFFSIGATMGERFIFHSSFGWCILIIFGIRFCYDKLKLNPALKKAIFLLPGLAIITLFSFKTLERNAEWKNEYTLFTSDVKTVPNSAWANSNAGSEIFNAASADYRAHKIDSLVFQKQNAQALFYFSRAIKIYPNYIVCYQNRGLCYSMAGDEDKAAADWMKAASIYKQTNSFLSTKADFFLKKGIQAGANAQLNDAVKNLQYAAGINPLNAEAWNNLGGAYFKSGQFKKAIEAFDRSLAIDPNYQDSMNGKNTTLTIYKLEQQYLQDKTNESTLKELNFAYTSCGINVSPDRLDPATH